MQAPEYKTLDLGRTTYDEVIAIACYSWPTDYDAIKYEIETTLVVNTSLNIVPRLGDQLHCIRTDPPLPLEFNSGECVILNSVWHDRGLEFVDPIPLSSLYYTLLSYRIVQPNLDRQKTVTVITSYSILSERHRRKLYTTQANIIELVNGTQIRILNGTIVIIKQGSNLSVKRAK